MTQESNNIFVRDLGNLEPYPQGLKIPSIQEIIEMNKELIEQITRVPKEFLDNR